MKPNPLRARITELRLTQKDVAVRIVNWLEANAPEEKVQLNTVEPKLSKLLAGDVEGLTFFRRSSRTQALALALKMELRQVEAAISAVQLLLDPRLPTEVVLALKYQADESQRKVELIDIPFDGPISKEEAPKQYGPVRARHSDGDAVRIALRDESDKRPQAIVVLASDDDLAWLEGRRREKSFVNKVPRGYELASFPTLLPIRPPSPPAKWSDESPLMAHPELTSAVRMEAAARSLQPGMFRRRDQARDEAAKVVPGLTELPFEVMVELADRLFAADEQGEEAAFPLRDVLGWLTDRAGGELVVDLLPKPRYDARPKLQTSEAVELTLDEVRNGIKGTRVWCWKKQLFALGPDAARFAATLRPHHEVILAIPALEAWREALEVRNPFETEAFSDLTAAAYTAAGLSLKGALASWAAQVAGSDAPGAKEVAEVELPKWTPAEEAEARLAISALAARPMCVPPNLCTLRLRLELASRSPLSPMPRARFDVAHVLANVGAGRVIRVRIAQFAGEGQGQLRFVASRKSVELDGDGTHIWVDNLYDEQLEGTFARARARRREAEEAARRADDDYYDDDD